MTKTTKFALSVIAALAMIPSIQAAPVTGTIRMDGSVTLDSKQLSLATKASFNNLAVEPIGLGAGKVDSGDGSFGGVPAGTGVSFSDFTFSPLPGSTPVAPLWSFTVLGVNYSFDLNNITSVSHIDDTFLLIQGSGILHVGADSADGSWAFSITDTSAGTSGFKFGFSQSDTAVVPEASGTVILMGLGLLALVGFASLRKQVA